MPKGQVNPFGENLLDEGAAEAEELGTTETPAVETAATETTAEPKPATEQQPAVEATPERGPIPYQRFQEVNEKARKAESEASELRERWARLEERQKVIREAGEQAQRAAQQQQVAAQRPDESIDPVGAKQWDHDQQIANLTQQLNQAVTQIQNYGQNYQQTQEQAQFSNWVQATAQQYAQQDPEYQSKVKFGADSRIGFWQELGPQASPDVCRKMVEAESVLIARFAQQYGGNFAPVIAKYANTWGYQPTAQQQPIQQNGVAQQRLAQVAAGQKVQGISRIPGAGPAQQTIVRNLSPVDLANMSEAEFARIRANPQMARELAHAMAAAEGIEPEEMMSALKSA